MKAILVIDVPETIKIKYLNRDLIVQLWDKDDEHYIMHDICALKQLPQKKNHKEYSWNAEKIETTNAYEDGWNDCLEEIEK